MSDTQGFGRREEAIERFWASLWGGRIAFSGRVSFYPQGQVGLTGWVSRIKEELARFLDAYTPDKRAFVARCIRRLPNDFDEQHLRYQLSQLAASDFAEHLRRNGVPADIAARASSTYSIELSTAPAGGDTSP